jgi:hypothetical protein
VSFDDKLGKIPVKHSKPDVSTFKHAINHNMRENRKKMIHLAKGMVNTPSSYPAAMWALIAKQPLWYDFFSTKCMGPEDGADPVEAKVTE